MNFEDFWKDLCTSIIENPLDFLSSKKIAEEMHYMVVSYFNECTQDINSFDEFKAILKTML